MIQPHYTHNQTNSEVSNYKEKQILSREKQNQKIGDSEIKKVKKGLLEQTTHKTNKTKQE